jgi:redox-regulated HSP33 family molecular chaperone
VRAYARFDAVKLDEIGADGAADSGALLGHGHLAMTIEPGGDRESWAHALAWMQWTPEELKSGEAWDTVCPPHLR